MEKNSEDIFFKKAKQLTSELTDEEKLSMLTTHHAAVERLGLNEFYIGTEVARGYVGRSEDRISTVFPQPVGLAATFDKELMLRLGRIAGIESRAYYNMEKKGGLALWGPTVDMVRDPRWGRAEEAYGEDVCLAGEMTRAYTLGMAGENEDGYYLTVPTLKHFCANNNETNRGSCDAYLPPRLKYEYYYAAFENAIRYGGARSVMAAYNEINGLPAVMNPELKSILKDEWGLWFAVSDGGDFSQNVLSHRYCEDYAEAYKLSLTAGCDVMTDDDRLVKNAAVHALERGLISWEDIDDSIVNTLYARLKLGQTDSTEFDEIGSDVIDCEEHRKVNARAAAEQITLLKNNGILPLGKKPGRIAVVGALADESLMDWYTGYASYRCTLLDGMREEFGEILHDSLWDIVALKASNGKYLCAYDDGSVRADSDEICEGAMFELQDWGENWKNLFSVRYKRYVRLFDDGSVKLHNRTIYDWFTRETFNFKNYFGSTLVEEFLTHKRLTADKDGELSVVADRAVKDNCCWNIELLSSGRERAVKIANECDTVVYCVGNYPVQTAKECYDRKTLSLNIQQGMTQEICRANRNTVLFLISSYPYAAAEESESAAAVIWSSHAGAELGKAAAGVISGRINPAGRLPLTWYRSELDLPDIMDYDIENAGTTYMYFDGEPLYPFGHGLSYSQFGYEDMKTMENEDGSLTAEVTVKNLSDRDGDEVVQLYYRMENSAVSRPIKKLCAFERVHIPAGETLTVMLEIPRHQLRVYDVRAGKMIVEGGEYTFMAGGSSAKLPLECKTQVSGAAVSRRADNFSADSFDRAQGVRIRYSQKWKCGCVVSDSWSGKLYYGGLDLSGVKAVEVRALSMMNVGKIKVSAGESKAEAEIMPANSRDDFSLYRLEMPVKMQGEELAVTLSEGCIIKDICVVK